MSFETKMIKLTDIKINERLWDVTLEKAEKRINKLVSSIKEIGLINPITVLYDEGEYTLICGEHRLKAFYVLHKKEIPAIVKYREFEEREKDIAKCLLMECDENLIRRSSDGFEEGYMLYQRKINYEILYPESTETAKKSIAGKENSSNLNNSSASDKLSGAEERPKTFIQDTAEKLGINERNVERKVRRGEILDLEAGETTKELELPNVVIDKIISGKDEKAKVASKIHLETLKELDNHFDNKKERNKFFNQAFTDFKKETEEIQAGYQRNNPEEFATKLRTKIETEYLADHPNEEDVDALFLGEVENVLICTSKYLKKNGAIESFIRIYIKDETHFNKANTIANTFGSEDKIIIECSNDNVFSKYTQFILKTKGEM